MTWIGTLACLTPEARSAGERSPEDRMSEVFSDPKASALAKRFIAELKTGDVDGILALYRIGGEGEIALEALRGIYRRLCAGVGEGEIQFRRAPEAGCLGDCGVVLLLVRTPQGLLWEDLLLLKGENGWNLLPPLGSVTGEKNPFGLKRVQQQAFAILKGWADGRKAVMLDEEIDGIFAKARALAAKRVKAGAEITPLAAYAGFVKEVRKQSEEGALSWIVRSEKVKGAARARMLISMHMLFRQVASGSARFEPLREKSDGRAGMVLLRTTLKAEGESSPRVRIDSQAMVHQDGEWRLLPEPGFNTDFLVLFDLPLGIISAYDGLEEWARAESIRLRGAPVSSPR